MLSLSSSSPHPHPQTHTQTHRMALFRHHFFLGLEESWGKHHPSVNLGQKHARQELTSDASRLQALKERLEWQDERVVSKRTRSSGTSLLFWAVLVDDLSSVLDILRTDPVERK
jgi:hypothetical protein